ncbi:MAG: SsrA-binding protein [Verrucomicrobia bacterium RIFCSPLOWO2_12_FULL_64_8]|nr:MAG: SsrA-binding protein [Verrucomicrobia bacterium RIFCSPLOWO2_12_FULL_64_8]
MSAQPKNPDRYTEIRNAKAGRDYFIEEKFEAGLALRGTEVKSVRRGHAQISDAFGRVEGGEVWLHNAHIDPYEFGSDINHEVRRPRKLLLHMHEIRKIIQAVEAGGRALVPLRLYFKQALVKVELALATGKKLHDRREDLKRRAEQRDVDRALRRQR